VIKAHETLTDANKIAAHLDKNHEGKITYGLNIYGKKENTLARALEIKRKLKAK